MTGPDPDNRVTEGRPLGDVLAALNAIEFDGGCDDCPAYQTIKTVRSGVHVVTVHHEDSCPTWGSIRHRYPPSFLEGL